MTQVYTRPDLLYAWKGQSLLTVNTRGECGDGQGTSGFYFREARHLRTLCLEVNGTPPWLCEAAACDPSSLAFTFSHPEPTAFGGGGSGQSGDEVTTDTHGIPHRALDIRASYAVGIADLRIDLVVANRSRQYISVDIGWVVDADFADLQEALGSARQQEAAITAASDGGVLRLTYLHPKLPYATSVAAEGPGSWRTTEHGLATTLRLGPQQSARLVLRVQPEDYRDVLTLEETRRRVGRWREWVDGFARVTMTGNSIADDILRHNIRDLVSFPLLQGRDDEWLTMQAGIPMYPALFGRDAITAAWQAAFLDRGEALDATLTRLGRLQSERIDDWHDEEPGRIPQQVRQGPLARLDLNPYSAYYADYASPLMFVIALAHLYAWTGDRSCLERHWGSACRILDWARDYGDKDGDGYLEYETRSSGGTKNQGWKDSGDAIVYEDGSAVPPPIATCELQGYWFAAQQLMAALSWVMGARHDARAHWDSATALKTRFNHDWWVDEDRCVAFVLDRDKRRVRAVTSNAAHCLATGIVSDEHLPMLVGRLFASDMYSGWGIRTLSANHVAYNPLSYHLGSVWAVENATAVFGLRRFGFDARALYLSRGLFDLATLYPDYRIPECVGGYARGEQPSPGAYPRASAPQLWNASAFPLVVHAILGLQPVAPLELLVVDPVLPTWLPEVILHDLRLAGATATIRFWRDDRGASHAEVQRKRGTLHLVKQPPLESLSAGVSDRFGALIDRLWHH